MEKIRIICIEEWPAALCSFSSITRSKCESSRGCKESVHLNGCNANISTHLIKHHLLRESVSEKDPIFARAGLLEITEEQMQKMTVCPAHRHGWESTGRHRKLANIQDTKEKNRQFLEHMLLISRQLVKYKKYYKPFLLIWRSEERNAPCKAWFSPLRTKRRFHWVSLYYVLLSISSLCVRRDVLRASGSRTHINLAYIES